MRRTSNASANRKQLKCFATASAAKVALQLQLDTCFLKFPSTFCVTVYQRTIIANWLHYLQVLSCALYSWWPPTRFCHPRFTIHSFMISLVLFFSAAGLLCSKPVSLLLLLCVFLFLSHPCPFIVLIFLTYSVFLVAVTSYSSCCFATNCAFFFFCRLPSVIPAACFAALASVSTFCRRVRLWLLPPMCLILVTWFFLFLYGFFTFSAVLCPRVALEFPPFLRLVIWLRPHSTQGCVTAPLCIEINTEHFLVNVVPPINCEDAKHRSRARQMGPVRALRRVNTPSIFFAIEKFIIFGRKLNSLKLNEFLVSWNKN